MPLSDERGKSDFLMTLLGQAEGYATAKVLTASAKLGFFSPPFPPVSPEGLARDRQLPLRGVRLLLNALTALGIYEKKGNEYRLREGFRRLFGDHPELQDDLIHHDHLYDVWGRLEEGIRAGASVSPTEEEAARYPESLAVFLRAMRAHATYLAPEILSGVPWTGIREVLDIGGGGGGYALALARRNPDLKVTVADLPDAVELTKDMIAGEPEARRILFHPGNAYTDPLPEGPFDRIFISHLVHIYPADENRALVAKAARRLRPGGDLLLLDYFLNDAETGPREAVLFRLLMMIGTPKGDCYRLSEAKAWLARAGLTPTAIRALPRGNTLVVAQRAKG